MGKSKSAKKKSKGKSKSKDKLKDDAPPPVILQFGNGTFSMENGDQYEGEYCAHRVGIVWREGHGIYKTHDGQIYEGYWKDDVLVNGTEAIIKFPNKQSYHGRVCKNKANGPGTFMLDDLLEISCEFVDNKPVGHVILIDLYGHLWEGEALHNNATLFPENIFYKAITPDCGKGEIKIKKEPRRLRPPPLKLCHPDENILIRPEIGGYIFAKADAEKIHREDGINFVEEYFNRVSSEEQIAKPPKQLNAEYLHYDRVIGVRRRYVVPKEKEREENEETPQENSEESSKEVDIKESIEDEEINRSKNEDITEQVQDEPECALTDKEMEELVFGKSGKTSFAGVYSYEEKYIQDYVKFKRRKLEVLGKIVESGEGCLNDKEKLWYKTYKQFVKSVKNIVNTYHAKKEGKYYMSLDTSLLEQFYSKEWRNQWTNVVVFKPTPKDTINE